MKKIVVFGLISLIFLFGCSGSASYQVPFVQVEATVISITLDTDFDESPTDYGRPGDRGVIRIEKIITGHREIDLSVGDEVNAGFSFSARPTLIKYSNGPSFVIEAGEFVYYEGERDLEDVLLPGLSAGSRFTARMHGTPVRTPGTAYSENYVIGKYEIK